VALREESAIVDVCAWVSGRRVAQAEQTFVFNAVPLASAEEVDILERLERAELRRLWAGYPDD